MLFFQSVIMKIIFWEKPRGFRAHSTELGKEQHLSTERPGAASPPWHSAGPLPDWPLCNAEE